MKIFDCFSYLDEDLLLNLRFNILNDYVDHFVIVEGNKTWQNNPKTLKFNIDKFSKFKNKIIQLQVEPFTLQFKINDFGQLVSCDIQEHVDTTISLTSQAFIRMVVTKQKKGITVSGDVDLANIFSKIMLKARWDYEEDLSYLVGDIAAVEITKITRAFARDGKKSLQSVAENFVEYWQEEKQILITKAEVDKFNSGVDEIQESFSRVEAKINELLQNKSQ